MFASTKHAQDVLSKRYYAKGESSPHDVLNRVAAHIASAEEGTKQDSYKHAFYEMMDSGKFLPNSPCLVNAGTNNGGLFACFVIGVDDNLYSITEAKASAMAITKSGGGWGIGLSNLRPYGARVNGSTHGIAGGPIGFLETFSADMKTMTQGGFRDAACMATMNARHPDIERFIGAKSPANSIERLLNLEKVTDNKEAAARKLLENPVIAAAAETYLSNFNMSVLIDDRFMASVMADSAIGLEFDNVVYGKKDASEIFDAIVHGAWKNGEPGILFIDRIRERTRYDPDLIQSTNPCGEQPLPPNGSCCLGSLNLSAFVDDRGEFNYTEFGKTIRLAVRFLDNMISLNQFPTEETRIWSQEQNRSIGLGVMGFADALVMMGIEYASQDAIRWATEIASDLIDAATSASESLYAEKGGTYSFDGRRNNALLSVAPTGTISILAGCSPGIEPIFSSEVIRVDGTGTHIMNHSLSHMDSFVTLKDVGWSDVINIISAFSGFVDTSISYTLNMPNDASRKDVADAILYAWSSGCNGITVYRDGSRERQVLSAVTEQADGDSRNVVMKRPMVLRGDTFKFRGTVDGKSTNLYITINKNSVTGEPWEVFAATPYITSMTELQLVTTITRLTSLALRCGAPISEIIKQLQRVEGQSLLSIPAVISKALSSYISTAEMCPECGGEMIYQNGCSTCNACGHSSCG